MARDPNDRNVATGIEKRTITYSVSANEVNHPPRALSASVNGRVQMAVAKIVVVTTIKTSEAAANQATGLHRDDRRWPSGNHRNKKGSNAMGIGETVFATQPKIRPPGSVPGSAIRACNANARENPPSPRANPPASSSQPIAFSRRRAAITMPSTGTPMLTSRSKTLIALQPSESCGSARLRSTYMSNRVATISTIEVRPIVHATHRAVHQRPSFSTGLILRATAAEGKRGPSTRRAPTAAPPSDRARGR